MLIGTLQFELLIHGSTSLKDKRRVVRSVKDRLHREHLVSVAEVGSLEVLDVAVLGLAVVGSDGKTVGGLLDRVLVKLRGLVDAELGEVDRRLITIKPDHAEGRTSAEPFDQDAAVELAAELEAYFDGEAGDSGIGSALEDPPRPPSHAPDVPAAGPGDSGGTGASTGTGPSGRASQVELSPGDSAYELHLSPRDLHTESEDSRP